MAPAAVEAETVAAAPDGAGEADRFRAGERARRRGGIGAEWTGLDTDLRLSAFALFVPRSAARWGGEAGSEALAAVTALLSDRGAKLAGWPLFSLLIFFMGCASSRPPTDALPDAALQPHALAQAALAPPPLPNTQQLLGGLAKALELEYGPPNEVGALSTWVTLELEARPGSHFVEHSLQDCLDFVAAVESAVKAKAVTIDSLREHWGCPGEAVKRPAAPSGPVALADVVAMGSSPDSWRLRADVPDQAKVPHVASSTADDADSMDDDDSRGDDERDMLHDDVNPDGFGAGDGRYR